GQRGDHDRSAARPEPADPRDQRVQRHRGQDDRRGRGDGQPVVHRATPAASLAAAALAAIPEPAISRQALVRGVAAAALTTCPPARVRMPAASAVSGNTGRPVPACRWPSLPLPVPVPFRPLPFRPWAAPLPAVWPVQLEVASSSAMAWP